jgi:hypothetical protein
MGQGRCHRLIPLREGPFESGLADIASAASPSIAVRVTQLGRPRERTYSMWDINWVAMVLAAIVGFALGAIWFVPLFGKAWDREAGVTEAIKQAGNKPLIFGGAFLLYLFMAFILGHTLATYGNPGLRLSILIANGVGLGFVAPAFGVSYLFAHRSLKLFLMDAGYWILTYSLMGTVFGLMR